MQDLYNKIVVITGASSGAGRAIANAFSTTGATLVLAARREASLNEVADECRSAGASVYVVPTDVRDAADVAKLAQSAAAINGSIDIWINNAGVLAAGEFDAIPEEINRNVVMTNLIGYMNGAYHVLPYFKKQGYGILFNNISVGGWFPTPLAAAYTASKFGLRGFSESLKGELKAFDNIHVIDLYPAFLDTPGIQHAANYTGKVIKPAPPVYDPAKVAQVILQLTSDPVSCKTVGATSTFLRMGFSLLPSLTRSVTAAVIRKYLRGAPEISHTAGNVLEPVEYGRGVYGGWNRKLRPKRSTVALVAAGLFGLALLAGRR